MTIRETIQERERKILSPFACFSEKTKGREREEALCPYRTPFQKDRDKIIHSKAFRRLKYKTQVFIAPDGDHYRTRLTHTLEVSQIARTISRALALNEDLTEAIALGHDLGHTPFGHAGEATLNRLYPGGFHHAKQGVRVVEELENDYKGLNLTAEVRDGILKHSKGKGAILSEHATLTPETLEGQVVRVSDIIAYLNHDVDDAIRAGLLSEDSIPKSIRSVLGNRHSERIERIIADIVTLTQKEFQKDSQPKICLSETINEGMTNLRNFLYERVYESENNLKETAKTSKVIEDLYFYYLNHTDELKTEMRLPKLADPERTVCDFIAGMTDRFALNKFNELFLPKPWMIL